MISVDVLPVLKFGIFFELGLCMFNYEFSFIFIGLLPLQGDDDTLINELGKVMLWFMSFVKRYRNFERNLKTFKSKGQDVEY